MNSLPILSASIALAALGLAACGGPQHYVRDRAERDLRTRASFDLSCPNNDLVLTPLSSEKAVWNGKDTDAPKTMGVAGCGRRATYVFLGDRGYVMNSASNTMN